MDVYIYILKLEQGKYYVGKANNLSQRLEGHFNPTRRGSVWTDLYKPISVVKTFKTMFPKEDELLWTLKMMKQFGIENVRGSAYTQTTLTNKTVTSIEERLKSISIFDLTIS